LWEGLPRGVGTASLQVNAVDGTALSNGG
jgi:hypothetical protein